jgi:two-component system KDP operon response regulator KdpE
VVSFNDGTLHVDIDQREVTVDSQTVHLNPTLYRLLETLVRQQGQVVSEEEILELLGIEGPDDSSVARMRYVMWALRRKLTSPRMHDYVAPIETFRGVGYRLRSGSMA